MIKKGKQIYLLNLKGYIINEFISQRALSAFLGKSINSINKKNVNKDVIIRSKIDNKKYRVVTHSFYINNIDLIYSWKPYSSMEKYISNFKTKIIATKNNIRLEFDTMPECAKYLGITKQAVSLIIKENRISKSTGYKITRIKINNNDYHV